MKLLAVRSDLAPQESIILRKCLSDAQHEFGTQGGVVHVQIAIRESDDVAILDLQGKSTTRGDSELLSRHIRKVRAKGVQKVLLNLADLTQIDSSGVSIIARTYVSLRDQGGDLKLLRPGGHVLDVFKPLHLLDIIPSFEDETQALASFRPVQRQN